MSNKKKNIGIYCEYLSLKKDIPLFINELNEFFNVKLFVSPDKKDYALEILSKDIEVIEIKNTSRNLLNKFKTLLFILFGKLPKNRVSFELSRIRMIIGRKDSNIYKKFNLFLFKLNLLLPKFFEYDQFCKFLNLKNTYNFNNIDAFLIISPILDTYFIADVISNCKNIYCYIYSWDHPFKFKVFSKKIKYLTWSKSCMFDLIEEQSIKKQNIFCVGSTQFIFIDKFNSIGLQEKPKKRIIFSGFAAYQSLINLELSIIKLISYYLEKYNPEVEFHVRPYPNDEKKVIENFIDSQTNIFNANKITDGKKYSYYNLKYKQISDCLALFHCGTTLGIEASLLNIPTYLISTNLVSGLNRSDNFSKLLNKKSLQSHVKKYMVDPNPECYLDSENKLEEVIKNIQNNKESKMSTYLKNKFQYLSVSRLCKNIFDVIDI